MRAALAFALPVATTVLAGCGGSTVYNSYYASLYEPAQVTLAAANRPTLAVVRENPFPSDTDNQGVIAAMQAVNYGPKMVFSPMPRADDRYGYKVVLDFAASPAARNYECDVQPTPPVRTRPPGPIAVTAAFCVGSNLLSDATGSLESATGPDDPRFRRLIADLLVALTPPYDPKRIGDDPG